MTQPRAFPKTRFVYIIRVTDTRFYKIGITSNLEQRMSMLQSANHQTIFYEETYEVPYADALPIEQSIHKQWVKHWVRGEWFYFHPYDMTELKKIIWAHVSRGEMILKPKEIFP